MAMSMGTAAKQKACAALAVSRGVRDGEGVRGELKQLTDLLYTVAN